MHFRPWLQGRFARRIACAALALTGSFAFAYPGQLDATFGTGGIVRSKVAVTVWQNTPDGAYGIVRQADGKLVVAGSTGEVFGTIGTSRFALVRYNPDGSVDTTFGTQGRVNGGPAVSKASNVVLDAGGRIVVVGEALNATTTARTFAVARFLPDGTPDASFGTGGVVTTAIGITSGAKAARIDGSGRIVVVGQSGNVSFTVGAYAIARYEASGALDATFGNAGVVLVGIGATASSIAYDLAIDSLDRIVVAGSAPFAGAGIVRLLPSGALDTTFGGTGKVTIGDFYSAGYAVALDGAGRIVVAGQSDSAVADMAVYRLNADGTPDGTFGAGGIARAGFTTTPSVAYAIRIDASGRILVAGQGSYLPSSLVAGQGLASFFAFARFLANGALDTAFGIGGRQGFAHPSSYPMVARDLVPGDSGSYYWAGYGGQRFALGAINDAGGFVPGFNAANGGAVVTTAVATVTTTASTTWQSVGVAPDGKIVAAGIATSNPTSLIAVTRRLASGVPDPAFGGTGEIATQVADSASGAHAMLVDGTGRIVVAGYTGVAGFSRFALARFLPDGTRDAAFGVKGEVATSFGSGEATAKSLAIDGSGRLVAGGWHFDGTATHFALARYLDDGSLDPAFGAGGRVSVTAGSNAAGIKALRIDATGRIVAVGGAEAGGSTAIARFTESGALDTTFGTSGVATLGSLLQSGGRVNALAFDGSGRIVIGGASGTADANMKLAVARLTDTGLPDSSFGGASFIVPVSIPAVSEARAVTVDAQGAVIATGYSAGRIVLARFASDGSLDPAFANVGVAITSFFPDGSLGTGEAPGSASALALQADGLIVVAGKKNDTGEAVLARYLITSPPGTKLLTVAKSGPGAVASSPAGIQCGDACVADFAEGTGVTLTTTPTIGAHFVEWAGDCTGTGACTVKLDAARSVTATFADGVAPIVGSRFANLSTRMQVLEGDNVLIGGFVIAGTTPRTVVVRGRGPSLTAAGVPGVLADPTIGLYSGQTLIESNDDYGTSPNLAALQATGLAPPDPKDAAIIRTLDPGAYTAIVTGPGGLQVPPPATVATGVGIVEIFDTNPVDGKLINISTRGSVGAGSNVMIAGFIIQGDQPQTVIVRARGASLAQFGITNVLANPALALYSGQTVIAANDNWQASPDAAQILARGYAPVNALESAILITLQPGAYTAIVTGVGGSTGVAIVEVFAL